LCVVLITLDTIFYSQIKNINNNKKNYYYNNNKTNAKSKYRRNNNKINFAQILYCRLIVGSSFGSNYWNRLNSTISILEIDSKLDSIRANLKSTRFDSSQYSISILEIESNCQEIENNVIILRVTILRFV